MTSKNSSSASPKTNGRELMTYERLQQEPRRLRKVVWALGNQGWEDLEAWFLAERQAHLELAVDSADPTDREGHGVVARWLKHFLSITKEELVAFEQNERNPVPEGDPEFMDFDSASDPERPSSLGGVPSGTSSTETL